jgi:CBS domain-containing protein
MKVKDALRRSGIAVHGDATVRATAELMDRAGVGAVVVVDGVTPVGMVTDRDLVRRCLARGLPGDARVDGVMSTPPVTIAGDADLHDAFAVFRTNAVRRLVVVDGDTFAGVLSVDDLLVDLAGDLGDLARPVTAETLFGQHDGVLPVTA